MKNSSGHQLLWSKSMLRCDTDRLPVIPGSGDRSAGENVPVPGSGLRDVWVQRSSAPGLKPWVSGGPQANCGGGERLVPGEPRSQMTPRMSRARPGTQSLSHRGEPTAQEPGGDEPKSQLIFLFTMFVYPPSSPKRSCEDKTAPDLDFSSRAGRR